MESFQNTDTQKRKEQILFDDQDVFTTKVRKTLIKANYQLTHKYYQLLRIL